MPARWRSASTGNERGEINARRGKQRLVAVTLDEESIGRSNPDVEHEREVAIYDLLEQNSFRAGRPRRRALRAASEHQRQPAGVRHPPAKTARRWSRICSR